MIDNTIPYHKILQIILRDQPVNLSMRKSTEAKMSTG